MNDPWYRKLGFMNNPFSIKPAAYYDELIAYDLEFVYGKVDNGEMMFIEGPYGTGKTTILKNIINHYRGQNRILYYNFNKAEDELDLDSLLAKVNPFFKKLVGLPPKNVILLLDEVGTIRKKEANEILRNYKGGILKSVIFVSHDYFAVSFPEEIEKLMKGNVIRTAKLNGDEAVALIRRRIGDLEFLPDRIIKRLFVLSNSNPRKLLEYCEDVCKYAADTGDVQVSESHVKEVVKIREQKKQQAVKAKVESPKEALKQETPVAVEPVQKVSTHKAVAAKKEDIPEVPEYRVVFYENADKE